MALQEALVISPVFVALISFNSFLFAFPPTCFSVCLDLLLLIHFSVDTQVARAWAVLCRCFSEQDIPAVSSGMSFFKTHDVAPKCCISVAAKGQTGGYVLFVLNKSPSDAQLILEKFHDSDQ